jgi:UDP-3-O-[3-hydroxymyristoyl] glucosamine N-acyltransferase
MQKTLAEIATIIDGEVVGDKDLVVTGISSIQDAKEGDITFLANPKYIPFSKKTKAAAIITSRDIKISGKSIIRTDNPSLAFSDLIAAMTEEEAHPFKGIHESAFIGDECAIGKNVSIGPFAIIESHAKIGDHTVVYGGSYIGHHTTIGADCLIYPNVTVREHVIIGDRVILHSGTVIGSDGFGYVQVGGIHKKIPQVGTVKIEDDVEIGANVTIDRARFDQTIIGKGTKIDNLVQVAHNVVMGENCIIISQVGISGSTTIGKGVIMGGQAGATGHLKIGEGSIIFSRGVATKSVPAFARVSGFPAKPHNEAKRINAYMQRLPHYVKMIQELQKKIGELEKKIRNKSSSKNKKR